LADFQNLFKLLKDCILPPFCTVCGKVSSCYVCDSCKSFIRLTGENICLKCGQPYPVSSSDGSSDNSADCRSDRSSVGSSDCSSDRSSDGGSESQGIDKKTASGRICSLCKNEDFYFYKSRSFAFYEGTAAELIKKYKYRKYYFLKDILAGFLKTAYKNYYNEEKIDFIETVPDIMQQRDFNSFGEMQEQSLNHMQIIAARLAVLLNTPYSGNIKKIKKTSRQQLLDRSSRKLNPAGAFKVINRMQSQGKNYLVIDDVWTTGSTLNEVSIALKNAGADRVYLLTIARGT
jgi:competence protein ComFC